MMYLLFLLCKLPHLQISSNTSKEEPSQIQEKVVRTHQLDPQDRLFLVKSAQGSNSFKALQATTALITAVEEHAFAQGDVLKIIEQHLKDSKPDLWSSIWIAEYAIALRGRLVRFDDKFLRAQHMLYKAPIPTNKFSRDERQLVSNILASNDGNKRMLAGQILIRKGRLSAEDLQWLETACDSEAARGDTEERKYWKTVKRVIVRRQA